MTQATPPRLAPERADPAALRVEFHHAHRLTDPAAPGLHTWHLHLTAKDKPVGSLRATQCMFWQAGNLRDRMDDEGDLIALAARQLFRPDGSPTEAFEEAVDIAGSVLVIDQLAVTPPWDDPLIISSAIDRLAETHLTIALPTAGSKAPGCALLEQAAQLLDSEEFSADLRIIDTNLAAPREAADSVHERLRYRARHLDPWNDEDDEDEAGEGEALTARTAAVLRLALQELGTRAWQEATALGDEPLPRTAEGVFGSLPPITLHQNNAWRRQMARTFHDLAADLATADWVQPRCTGEEMALHLALAHADQLTRDRPHHINEHVTDLPEDRHDYDWATCSSILFEDHDVLILFDTALDGIEDPDNDINQRLGMINLTPADWFTPFDPDHPRDPDRGFPST